MPTPCQFEWIPFRENLFLKDEKWHIFEKDPERGKRPYKKKGVARISRTFDTRGDAEAWAKVMESEMVRGIYIPRKEAESTTLSEALDRYEKEVSSAKKGHRREKTRISIWKNHPLAKRVLASVRGNDLAAYRDERIKAGYSANTIRLELAIISHLFEIARKEWGMEGLHNPVKAIRMPSPPAGRDRRLQPGELEKLLESSSEEMNQVIRFALETAMRRGELAGMTWEMVYLKKRTVTLPETKNGQKRIVPLSSVALSITRNVSEPDDWTGRYGILVRMQSHRTSPGPARMQGFPDFISTISGTRRPVGFSRRDLIRWRSERLPATRRFRCWHGIRI